MSEPCQHYPASHHILGDDDGGSGCGQCLCGLSRASAMNTCGTPELSPMAERIAEERMATAERMAADDAARRDLEAAKKMLTQGRGGDAATYGTVGGFKATPAQRAMREKLMNRYKEIGVIEQELQGEVRELRRKHADMLLDIEELDIKLRRATARRLRFKEDNNL